MAACKLGVDDWREAGKRQDDAPVPGALRCEVNLLDVIRSGDDSIWHRFGRGDADKQEIPPMW